MADESIQVVSAVPQFVVRDAVSAAQHYVERFGFSCNFTWGDPPTFAAVGRNDAVIHLLSASDPLAIQPNRIARPGTTDAYLLVRGVDALHEELVRRGAKVTVPPQTWEYGMRDFSVEDADGYHICFGEEVEEAP